MKKTILLLFCAALPWSTAGADNKHVVELFTSQGCYSCPPADRLLGEMIKYRHDIVALGFHVDYWNNLVYGGAGSWTDPFSDRAYTRRQRLYDSRGLEGNNGVYTPQAVVDGRTGLVGSNGTRLKQLLAAHAPDTARVMLENGGGSLRIKVSGDKPTAPADVWLYRFDVKNVTQVTAGENNGKTLVNHHVVREIRRLGDWQGREQEYIVDDFMPDGEQGCAVVVQRPNQGPILGADLCPS